MSGPMGPGAPAPFAKVAVERGLDAYPEGLTYGVPEGLDVVPGDLVRVPLGPSRGVQGWVTAIGGAELLGGLAAAKIRSIEGSAGVRLPPQVLQLATWVSSYYCCPIGQTLASVLPAAVRRGIGAREVRMVVRSTAALPARVTRQQRGLLEALEKAAPEPVEEHDLAQRAGLRGVASVRTLIRAGVLEAIRRTVVEAQWAEQAIDSRPAPVPSEEQRRAIDDIGATLAGGFSRHLLFGVTGSGKTEVYLSLLSRVLSAGGSALVLVPEIALTPQTAGRLLGRLAPHRVLILHSGLTQAQRHEQWRLALSGEPTVVLGARSAVFAPIPDRALRLVVVDEEHDTSYKQDQAPRYHGRDVAIRRAQLAKCPVLLCSATPSLESWHNATVRGITAMHRLPRRAPGLRTPRVEVVDFRAEVRQWADRRVHLLGPTLRGALTTTLAEGGQAILLLNRRGYANFVACPDQRCGWILDCDHCDARLVVHRTEGRGSGKGFVRCHHCLEERRLPRECPRCGRGVSVFGLGTQRIEEELARDVPALAAPGALVRVDSDSMHGAQDFHDTLGRFGRGEIRALLGTQMLAKGLDFPGVRLVGVISADTAINLPDFRAAERTFQLVAQVAGRCGRGADPGRAIVQTFQPDAEPIRRAALLDFEGFAKEELAQRERHGLPPSCRMARLVVRDRREDAAMAEATRLAEAIRGLPEAAAARIPAPTPCPLRRIADRFRVQVEILAPGAEPLAVLVAAARRARIIVPGAALAVDVDPVALL